MSSHRFPHEEPPPSPPRASDGPIGTVRAHDQAAIDHFLIFAEQERRRLEAKVLEAEMRCREAEAQLTEATLENQRVAEELYAMWLELKAQRDHNEQLVSQRLIEVRAEAEELAHWTDQRQPALEPRRAARLAPRPATPVPPPVSLHYDDADDGDDGFDQAAAAFFDDGDGNYPAWATLDDESPHVHEELLARHPRRTPDRSAPRPPEPGVQGRRQSPPDPSLASAIEQEFWNVDPSAGALRVNQLESTMMSLLPMFGLVIVLVLLLAWVG